jgi:putative ABC transport system permease protein
MWTLARRSAWAHRAGLTGTALVLTLAGALLAVSGVLAESGLRTETDPTRPASGLLLVLASSFSGTVLIIVVMIVSATVTLALRGRRRELALLRAVGATSSQIRRLVSIETVLVALASAPLGAVAGVFAARLLDPLLRDASILDTGETLHLSALPVVAAMVLLLPVAWLAARLATRETLRTPPSQAVRASTVEASTIGRARRICAVALAALGLGSAFSPAVAPGTTGSASAAISAFLLVGAAGLAGPLLIEWAFSRVADRSRPRGPAWRLAIANVRGFSRRLTVVVIPLALALTAGTAQTSADRAFAEAGAEQLRDGIGADLVATSADGFDPAAVDTVADLPGVEATAPIESAAAQVLTDADLDGVIDALAWETTTVRSYSTGGDSLVDLDVREGSVDDLARPDTIAISSEALFGERVGLGDTVTMQWTDGTTTTPTVVAVYDRGLGFGDFTVDRDVLAEHAQDAVAGAVLLTVAPGTGDDVAAAAAAQGIDVVSPAAYADTATMSGAAEQRLSTVLLLALMAFIFLAAANTLVMVTARRGPELLLYDRTGATRRQLTTMAVAESVLTGGLAWLIGTLAVAPAVLGVGFGMLGLTIPPVNLTAYLVLSAAVLVLPLLTVVPTVLAKTGRVRTPSRASATP